MQKPVADDHRDPFAAFNRVEHRLDLLPPRLLDEDVDLAAAGQADRPGLLVGDPVGEELRLGAGEDGLGLLVDLVLDTAA